MKLVRNMRLLLALLGLVTLGSGYYDDKLVTQVNKRGTWLAGRNEYFTHMNLTEISKLMGARETTTEFKQINSVPEGFEAPTAFDSRLKWPKCNSTNQIRDQGRCGSCWAFGAVEAFTDRWCIASNQASNPIMSTEDLTTCDKRENGCEGGMLGAAWEFIVRDGLYLEDCQPYTIPSCKAEPCMPDSFVRTPRCRKGCYGNKPASDKRYKASGEPYSVGPRADAIQNEMMTHGPVEAAFTVYSDFLHYKSGVYDGPASGAQELGGHAVKIMGWGRDSQSDENYWLVANSWTTGWGDQGYFKIKMGNCGINDGIYASHVTPS